MGVRYTEHKTAEKTGSKTLYLARQEIELIEPYIGERTEGYIFRPIDGIQQDKTKRATKANGKNVKKQPSRAKRDAERRNAKRLEKKLTYCYNPAAYRKAIERACQRAGIPAFFPYMVRHTGITEIGLKYGITAAQHAAGHTDSKTTAVYFHGADDIRRDLAIKRNSKHPVIQTALPSAPATSEPANPDLMQIIKQQNTIIALLAAQKGIKLPEFETKILLTQDTD